MIVLLGHSASGKSTIERYMEEEFGYKRIISCTTRPPRMGEQHGVDYYYMDEGVFTFLKDLGLFAETTTYRDWHYGILADRCKVDGLAVLEPHGTEQMIGKLGRDNLLIVFVSTDEDVRRKRLEARGDDPVEANRRLNSDRELFSDLSFSPDLVFFNNYETRAELEDALQWFIRLELEPELRKRGW